MLVEWLRNTRLYSSRWRHHAKFQIWICSSSRSTECLDPAPIRRIDPICRRLDCTYADDVIKGASDKSYDCRRCWSDRRWAVWPLGLTQNVRIAIEERLVVLPLLLFFAFRMPLMLQLWPPCQVPLLKLASMVVSSPAALATASFFIAPVSTPVHLPSLPPVTHLPIRWDWRYEQSRYVLERYRHGSGRAHHVYWH